MDLLTAVNTVLPHLGEHIVTRVEGARHPTVDLITNAIENHRMLVLAEGLWFNDIKRTLTPNPQGRIDTPTDIIAIYGGDCDIEIDGEYLYDLKNDSRIFTSPIKVRLIKNIGFEKLPYTAASFIMYKAAAEVYIQDYGTDGTAQYLLQSAQQSYEKMSQENIRKRRYNSTDNLYSRRFRRLLRR